MQVTISSDKGEVLGTFEIRGDADPESVEHPTIIHALKDALRQAEAASGPDA